MFFPNQQSQINLRYIELIHDGGYNVEVVMQSGYRTNVHGSQRDAFFAALEKQQDIEDAEFAMNASARQAAAR